MHSKAECKILLEISVVKADMLMTRCELDL